MILHEISVFVAEAIPYIDFKDKINKVSEELRKGRRVEVWDNEKLIYSSDKWRDNREQENLQNC